MKENLIACWIWCSSDCLCICLLYNPQLLFQISICRLQFVFCPPQLGQFNLKLLNLGICLVHGILPIFPWRLCLLLHFGHFPFALFQFIFQPFICLLNLPNRFHHIQIKIILLGKTLNSFHPFAAVFSRSRLIQFVRSRMSSQLPQVNVTHSQVLSHLLQIPFHLGFLFIETLQPGLEWKYVISIANFTLIFK